MSHFVMLLALFSSSFTGFICLSLTIKKYINKYQQPSWFKPENSNPMLIRILGWILLASSLVVSVRIWGFAIGLPAWFGLITLPATIQVLILSYCKEIVFIIFSASLIITLMSFVFFFLIELS